ncbi:MAG: PD-(D/E)XK nuclease family protein [Prevotellaceae bacterium]|nr:PD-(D/E)XK nuclease family protein [Prevotellaceae bacterium]
MEEIQKIKNILGLLVKIDWAEQEDAKSLLLLTERVNTLILESENKPKYQLNVLDLVNISEPLTSQLLKLLFKYRLKDRYIICEAFLKHFLEPLKYDAELFSRPKITAETEHIDVGIQEKGKYAVIIENKLKGAVFQRNQLARYIQKMRNEGYNDDQIFIIILPGYVDRNIFDHINKSVWRLPFDWDVPNQERTCAFSDSVSCMCDFDKFCQMCDKCVKNLRDKFKSHTLVLDIEMVDWLENDCLSLIPNEEIVFRTAIIQFIDFLKGRYNKRLNNKLIMELEQFLRNQLLNDKQTALEQWESLESKKQDVNNLLAGLESLQKSIGKDLIEEWRTHLVTKWSKYMKNQEHKSFGINMNGVWCGCWYDTKEWPKPFWWGFQCDNPTEEQKAMVERIIEKVGIRKVTRNPENGWIAWYQTFRGDERCEAFYEAAKELGYIK